MSDAVVFFLGSALVVIIGWLLFRISKQRQNQSSDDRTRSGSSSDRTSAEVARERDRERTRDRERRTRSDDDGGTKDDDDDSTEIRKRKRDLAALERRSSGDAPTCLESCPDDWTGDGIKCTAPESYMGPLSKTMYFPLEMYTTKERSRWSRVAKVPWKACSRGRSSDDDDDDGYAPTCTKSCPDDWTGDGVTCVAPDSYTGPANKTSVFPLPKWGHARRRDWAQRAQAPWASCEACAKSCPDGWTGDGLKCTAPDSYTGAANTTSYFPLDKYPIRKRLQWSRNAGAPWTACTKTYAKPPRFVMVP